MKHLKILFVPVFIFVAISYSYAGIRDIEKKMEQNKISTIFYPTITELSKTYFLNGIPFSVTNRDSSYIVLALEQDKIAGYNYMRLWLLYQNKIDNPYLYEPLKSLRLVIDSKKDIYNISPTSPTEILSRIDSEKLGKQILQVIGGALQTVSAGMSPEATITDPSGGVYKIDDKNASGNIINRTVVNMQSTSYMYEAYKNSVNNIILRRNTVFKDKNIMGYVYFNIPNIKPKNVNKINLYLTTQDGIQMIEFTPQDGE
ncbi:MAG: hypothetical protein KJ620_06905 [Candidatus Edwardsbacteria bacterium]|nr:hypothetical protein [Candidatus Edwardsbacteria bacterium]MBU1576410.1 hypothetical protein [Candidatus Edwardsbacteria bacterium]MBU2593816.1 hypothetical protein [Candidatus Edwardsbacteria bacterium]